MQNFNRGKELKKDSYDLIEKLYGPKAIKTANSLNNLAISLENLGDYSEGLEYKCRALNIYGAANETDKLDYAILKNNAGISFD